VKLTETKLTNSERKGTTAELKKENVQDAEER